VLRLHLLVVTMPQLKEPVMLFNKFITATALLCSVAFAHALEVKPYTAAALAEAEKAGKPVAVHFHADWCPTCKAQTATLQNLKTEPGLELTVLVADYDNEKDLKKRFNVRGQSTLIVLKGDKEITRLIGDTSANGIRTALKAGLKTL
jgi:thioredoxin 1